MRIITFYLVLILLSFLAQNVNAQETEAYKKKIETLKELKHQIENQEKEALKYEVEDINKRLDEGVITKEEAILLKENAAKKRALNIENRIAILDNEILLLERNKGKGLTLIENDTLENDRVGLSIDINGKPTILFNNSRWKRKLKYDRRTYSDFVFAIGLNNVLIDGQSLEDSPYKIGGSRFFEFGWAWRTRVFKNSNFLRLNYGVSFQYNGLKPKGNQIFVRDNGQTVLEEFGFDLRKSKFRMDNLVFPVHFEFGPSKLKETEKTIRYSLRNKFRIGIGGYGGFNLGVLQKLKYKRDGENIKDKFKRGYNTSNFVYGLSAYTGFGGVFYAKYDLNPIFKNATVEQRNISLGLRFDL